MQEEVIKPGQNVIVVDDLIATGKPRNLLEKHYEHMFSGGSAKAAGELIAKEGGKTLEYLFIIELVSLKGGDELDGPVYSIVQSND